LKKENVDKIITKYLKKIFGFSLKKTGNIEKAEELSSQITFEVYKSLLKTDKISNIEGYVFRVSQNVFARFLEEEKKEKYLILNQIGTLSSHSRNDELSKNNTFLKLKKEISYLGFIQRQVIVMFYFDRIKLKDIATQLSLPLGTIKWHLHDARIQLKENIIMSNEKNLTPIKLAYVGYYGGWGTTYQKLYDLLNQNILYVTYHQPKSIEMIARELGIPCQYIEEKVKFLVDNSFLVELTKGKYISKLIIEEYPDEIYEKIHQIATDYAKKVSEAYIPEIINCIKDYKNMRLYTPNNDVNFLNWAMISFAITEKLQSSITYEMMYENTTLRTDGSNYIPISEVAPSIYEKYKRADDWNGPLTLGEGPSDEPTRYVVWDLGTAYADKVKDRSDDEISVGYEQIRKDYLSLYHHISGKLEKSTENAEKFKKLYELGFIIQTEKDEFANMVVVEGKQDDLIKKLPEPSKETQNMIEQYSNDISTILTPRLPKHLTEFFYQNWYKHMSLRFVRPRILKHLVDTEVLKKVTDYQKLTLNTIFFCDTLPK